MYVLASACSSCMSWDHGRGRNLRATAGPQMLGGVVAAATRRAGAALERLTSYAVAELRKSILFESTRSYRKCKVLTLALMPDLRKSTFRVSNRLVIKINECSWMPRPRPRHRLSFAQAATHRARPLEPNPYRTEHQTQF